MLGTIRDKATGWIAGIIVGLLIISFAFWGVSFYFGQGGDVKVASVNGTDIKLKTFQRAFYNFRQQMKSALGKEPSLEEDALIKEQTLQKLVTTELVNQVIKENNLRVSNAQVLQAIKNLELFQGEGGFDRAKYEQTILKLGMKPAYFEQQMRMDMLSEQLQAGLSETLFVMNAELQDILRLKLQTRDITYSILAFDDYSDDTEINDKDIETYYQSHPDHYADPEKVKIAYVELDAAEIAKSIKADEESLRKYYDENKDNYDVAEQRSLTKLFIKVDKDTSEEDKAKAKKVMESALELAKQGKTLEEVVKQFTKEGKGGLEFSEHAFMTAGILDKKLDEFLFSADENALSDIIETENGFNIIKVGKIRGGPKNKFENVAEQVEHDYKQAQAELQYFELADQLTTLSYEHSDTLDLAAEATGQVVKETDFFSRNSAKEGILSNAKVISSSFDPELISSGLNSEAIELSDNHIVVLRVLDHKAATTKPLSDVKDEVIADIRKERTTNNIRKAGESIVQQLKSGVKPEEIKSDVKIEWLTADNVKRNDVNVSRAVLRTAFKAGKPVNGTPAIAGQVLGSGDYAVVVVKATHDGNIEENNDEISKATDLELRRTRGSTEWQEFLKDARDNADVKIYKDNI